MEAARTDRELPSSRSALQRIRSVGIGRPLEARDDAGRIVVWGSAGTLRLGYRSLALRLDTGAPLALAALADGARRYWAAWSARE